MQDTLNVLNDIARERQRQDGKWGTQRDHPDGTGPEYSANADWARSYCDLAFSKGLGTWKDILLEEVWEAFAEEDPQALREELVQVAAVACCWVEAINARLAE